MLQLGVAVEWEIETDGIRLHSEGNSLTSPAREPRIDCGNSGTTARLMAGVLTGSGIGGVLDGDASLRNRPMRRVAYPLQAMGARVDWLEHAHRLPIRFRPRSTGSLRTLSHRPRVASAQVKSALLLAGLLGRVRVSVQEPVLSRDHTERLLSAMGAPIEFDPDRTGQGSVHFDPTGWDGDLRGLSYSIPGDPSAAAFLIAAALLSGTALELSNVSANPGRTAFLNVLEEMGADISRRPRDATANEPREDWTVQPGDRLRAVSIGGEIIPSLIDEIPILGVLASRADGSTEIRDAAELRVKESDRIGVLAETLVDLGVRVEERADGLRIQGEGGPLKGACRTRGDHRMAMAFGVLDRTGDAEIEIDDEECTEVSFPGFWEALDHIALGRDHDPDPNHD